jgi:hypothetical protein
LALNLLTEEGLPHFHRILAVYLATTATGRRGTILGPQRRIVTA